MNSPEGTTRCCEDDPPQPPLRQSLDALKDGRMLRVCWQNVDAVFFCQRQNVGPSCNERLLIGQCNVLPSLYRCTGRLEPRTPHNAGDHCHSLVISRHLACQICHNCRMLVSNIYIAEHCLAEPKEPEERVPTYLHHPLLPSQDLG